MTYKGFDSLSLYRPQRAMSWSFSFYIIRASGFETTVCHSLLLLFNCMFITRLRAITTQWILSEFWLNNENEENEKKGKVPLGRCQLYIVCIVPQPD